MGVLAKFVSWKIIGARLAQNVQHFRQASTRNTFVRFQCAALSSSFDVRHFRQVSMHLRDPPWCTPALWLFWHWWFMCSVNMLLKPILIQAIVVNTYVYGSHLQKISVLYIKHTCSFWGKGGGGGGGSKEITRFRFFANIGNYGRPLSFVDIGGWHWLFSCSTRFTDFEAIPLRELKLFRAQWKLFFFFGR